MGGYSHDKYDIQYYRTPSSGAGQIDYFAPSLQSLKSAQDIIRRYEKKRRAEAKLSRQGRGARTTRAPTLGAAVSDNVIPFRSPVWTRPSSRLVYSRHASPPYTRSSSPYARRATLQQDARRLSRNIRALTSAPVSAFNPIIIEGVQRDMLGHFGVMAIQAAAVVLGLSCLLALLTLF